MSLNEENNLNNYREEAYDVNAPSSCLMSEEMVDLGECESENSAVTSPNSSELEEYNGHGGWVMEAEALPLSTHRELYKYTGPDGWATQEKRRQMFLDDQKKKRCITFDKKRNLHEVFMETEVDTRGGGGERKRRRKKGIPFKVKMMDSEWFIHLPDDLQDNWLVKFCLNGVRVVVVASKGKTYCYLKRGAILSIFRSHLPGGDYDDGVMGRFTILDCIYNRDLNVIFVYDVIAWNSVSLVDLEAQHRFSWLKSKFEESPEILIINETYNFKFVLVDCYPARKDIIQDQLFNNYIINDIRIPFNSILFYHKEGHYVFECSPLVGWLRIFMLPEVLNIDVPEIHVEDKPANYVSLQQYIIEESKKKTRRKNNKVLEVEMKCIEQAN